MQFEVIRKSHKKEVVIGVVTIILIAVVLLVRNSFAKYQTIKNLKIAEGTINYTVPDFKIMGIYYQKEGQTCTEDSCYEEKESMPESGYKINTEKSYCTTDNVNKVYNKVFTNEEGKHVITGLSKDSKCYIYFDKSLCSGIACKLILANAEIKTDTPDFGKTACKNNSKETTTCGEETNGLYKAEDDDGISYYFRGTVEDNWLKFAEFYWRIIRINGNGGIRLLYYGNANDIDKDENKSEILSNGYNDTAKSYTIIGSTAFNSRYSNAYVGYMYGETNSSYANTHRNVNNSIIKNMIDNWYKENLIQFNNKMDINTGFCGDRNVGTGSGAGIAKTNYAYWERGMGRNQPSLKCDNKERDLYTTTNSIIGNKTLTYPIGLITADEIQYAGGMYWGASNTIYFNNGWSYWTMTPYAYGNNGGTEERDRTAFLMTAGSYNMFAHATYESQAVRPVINLRSDIKLTGAGTASDPYVVE